MSNQIECSCGRLYKTLGEVDECKECGHFFTVDNLRELNRSVRTYEVAILIVSNAFDSMHGIMAHTIKTLEITRKEIDEWRSGSSSE